MVYYIGWYIADEDKDKFVGNDHFFLIGQLHNAF